MMLSQRITETLNVERLFSAPPSRVFRAWTNEREILAWFGGPSLIGHSAMIDLRTGGRWQVVFAPPEDRAFRIEGEYLEIVPDRLLVFTFRVVEPDDTGKDRVSATSRVTARFEAETEYTRLHLRHEDIGSVPSKSGISLGWDASLARLDRVFTTSRSDGLDQIIR